MIQLLTTALGTEKDSVVRKSAAFALATLLGPDAPKDILDKAIDELCTGVLTYNTCVAD